METHEELPDHVKELARRAEHQQSMTTQELSDFERDTVGELVPGIFDPAVAEKVLAANKSYSINACIQALKMGVTPPSLEESWRERMAAAGITSTVVDETAVYCRNFDDYVRNTERSVDMRIKGARRVFDLVSRQAMVAMQKRKQRLVLQVQGAQSDIESAKIQEKLTGAMVEFIDWEKANTTYRLQANECSRLHKLREGMTTGVNTHVVADDRRETLDKPREWAWENAKTFVVKHDWCSVLGEVVNTDQFVMPFPVCAFEFKVNGRLFIVLIESTDGQELDVNTRCATFFTESTMGVWSAFDASIDGPSKLHPVFQFLMSQVLAVCAMLEASVAEHAVIRQPAALNKKREKTGKLPLYDYHVVDLSKRHRAERSNNAPTETGRHGVRMHVRRGHWRHYATSKTWIKWMLVGDPSLGFVEKEYKL